MKKQAIVRPCYNRTEPLIRLLNSLDRAKYYQSIDIVFSIDFSFPTNMISDLFLLSQTEIELSMVVKYM